MRRERERILGGPAARRRATEDWVALLPAAADGPAEQAERREAIARSREALQALKPQELRALTPARGGLLLRRDRRDHRLEPDEDQPLPGRGARAVPQPARRAARTASRCEELRPLLSAFCDGEAEPEQVAAAARAPAGVRAPAGRRCGPTGRRRRPRRPWLPLLPPHRSLLERAHEAFAERRPIAAPAAARSPRRSPPGRRSGAGGAALAKVAAVCIGAAGGAAACVAAGVVPAPYRPATSAPATARRERRVGGRAGRRSRARAVEYAAGAAPAAEGHPSPRARPEPTAHRRKPKPAAGEPERRSKPNRSNPLRTAARSVAAPAPAKRRRQPPPGSSAREIGRCERLLAALAICAGGLDRVPWPRARAERPQRAPSDGRQTRTSAIDCGSGHAGQPDRGRLPRCSTPRAGCRSAA